MFYDTIWNAITVLWLASATVLLEFVLKHRKITDPERGRISLSCFHGNQDKCRKDLWWMVFFRLLFTMKKKSPIWPVEEAFYIGANGLSKESRATLRKKKDKTEDEKKGYSWQLTLLLERSKYTLSLSMSPIVIEWPLRVFVQHTHTKKTFYIFVGDILSTLLWCREADGAKGFTPK